MVHDVAGPYGFAPRLAPTMLLAGDGTQRPAIARVAEQLPPDTEGEILIDITAHDVRSLFSAAPPDALAPD
ncbi:SIP domain-containing protein [Agrobacterium sp. ES01]|uniref:SIP domain-containing protein n=1 Tax=Agrobacterium sp. ES01 TaxID=3420714 RepID=UPI003D12FA7F